MACENAARSVNQGDETSGGWRAGFCAFELGVPLRARSKGVWDGSGGPLGDDLVLSAFFG